jgi:TAT (twin-arginine translocation) pathway signal sequence
MSNKPSGDSSRRNFLTAAAVAGAAVAAPTVAQAQGATSNKKQRGIYRDTATGIWDDKIADFSYTNDALAQLIVDMWLGKHTDLISPEGGGTAPPTQQDYKNRSAAAKIALAERGIILQLPIVITEKEYAAGFRLKDADLLDPNGENTGVVFVLPRQDRAIPISTTPPSTPPPLLETAKMLMAITPNGI